MSPDQLDIFAAPSPPPARDPPLRSEPVTSGLQRARLRRTLSTRKQQVMACLTEAGRTGCTRLELSRLTAIPIQTVCPTVFSLREEGELVETEAIRNGGHVLVARRFL